MLIITIIMPSILISITDAQKHDHVFINPFTWYHNLTGKNDWESLTVNNNARFPSPQKFIVGGSAAIPGEFPFMAMVLKAKRAHCGGTILTPRHVLTARHCCYDFDEDALYPMEAFQIRAGEHSLLFYEGWEQIGIPSKCHLMERPPPGVIMDVRVDHAIFQLINSFAFNSRISAVPLAKETTVVKDGAHCLVAGWGSTQSTGNFRHQGPKGGQPLVQVKSQTLLKAMVPLVSAVDCRQVYGPDFDEMTMICAGYTKGGIDSCTGDSGGPILCPDSSSSDKASKNGQLVQVGIVSWGHGCAQPYSFGVYASISPIARKWIKQISGV